MTKQEIIEALRAIPGTPSCLVGYYEEHEISYKRLLWESYWSLVANNNESSDLGVAIESEFGSEPPERWKKSLD